MGVQCRLLGHVRDSTELEERQETRPNGTVLICREYQVCGRCGDREEMYRNEQVLTSAASEADTRTGDTTNETGSSEEESETHQASEEDAQETARAPVEASDAADTDPVTDDAVIISNSTTDVRPPTGDTPTRSEGDGTDNPLSTPVTDDAVILSDSPTDVNPSRNRNTATNSVAERDSSPRDARENRAQPSSFSTEENSHGQINCTSCGREWRRATTSLRDGDLCPACRQAYIEAA